MAQMTWTRRGVLSTGLAALFCRPTLAADAYPAHPLRFIVPQPPGGGNDALARVIAQKLAEQLGQQVGGDNRAGPRGMSAAQMAPQAPPAGYALFLGQPQRRAVRPHLCSCR